MDQDKFEQIIINNQLTYRQFAKKFNISVDDAIKIFQKLDLKKCSRDENCISPNGSVQSRSNFYNSKSKKDGLDSRCIYCQKQRYQNNKEYCKQKARQYHQNNKEYCNQRNHQYRQNNKEYFDQLNRQYHQNNKEHFKQLSYQYHQNNKEYFKQLHRQYRQNNKEYFKQKEKEHKLFYAKFDTCNERISYAEKIRRDPNNSELLQVKCTYCNQWFNPTYLQVQSRTNALEGKYSLGTESRFYCSDECKQACPIYYQKNYSKDDPNRSHIGTSREVQSELRQLVFERDNWTCQRCNIHKNNLPVNVSLHCHHIEGIRHEPIESADIDMCMTVCSECHKEIHQIPGCTRQDMRCNIKERNKLSIKS